MSENINAPLSENEHVLLLAQKGIENRSLAMKKKLPLLTCFVAMWM